MNMNNVSITQDVCTSILTGDFGLYARSSNLGPSLFLPDFPVSKQGDAIQAYMLLLKVETLGQHGSATLWAQCDATPETHCQTAQFRRWLLEAELSVAFPMCHERITRSEKLGSLPEAQRRELGVLDDVVLSMTRNHPHPRHPHVVAQRHPRTVQRFPMVIVDGTPVLCDVTENPGVGVDWQVFMAIMTGAKSVGVPAWRHGDVFSRPGSVHWAHLQRVLTDRLLQGNEPTRIELYPFLV